MDVDGSSESGPLEMARLYLHEADTYKEWIPTEGSIRTRAYLSFYQPLLYAYLLLLDV
jgi:hypothetical protein